MQIDMVASNHLAITLLSTWRELGDFVIKLEMSLCPHSH